MSLKIVLEVLNNIASVPSIKAKEKLIKEAVDSNIFYFTQTVQYALDHSMKYKIRKIKFVNRKTENYSDEMDLFNFLLHLSKKNGADNADRQRLSEYASIDEETVEVVNRILKGDLRCGAGRTLFRKYIDDIPKHEPMLCIDNVIMFMKTARTLDNVVASLKLDGVRTWAIVNDGKVKYISRNGKEFPNFDVFDIEILAARNKIKDIPDPVIFDGEVISKDHDFQKGLTQFRRLKKANKEIFEYHVFDIALSSIFSDRQQILNLCFPTNTETKVHKLINIVGFKDEEEIFKLLDKVTDSGGEGLVLKTLNGPYEYKRSNHWCKLKKFHTEDLPVTGWEYGTGRNKKVLGYLICNFNGVTVKVGSGFDDTERKEFIVNVPEMIEVRYQEITKDKSLRFPTFVRVREDK